MPESANESANTTRRPAYSGIWYQRPLESGVGQPRLRLKNIMAPLGKYSSPEDTPQPAFGSHMASFFNGRPLYAVASVPFTVTSMLVPVMGITAVVAEPVPVLLTPLSVALDWYTCVCP